MENLVNRRAILQGAPIALTAAAIGAGAVASSSRIQELYAEWRQLKDAAEIGPDEEEAERKIEEMFDLEGRIVAIEARTPQDLAIKLIVTTSDFDFDLSGQHAETFRGQINEHAGLAA